MLTELMNLPVTIVRRSASGVEDDYGNEIPAETSIQTVCEFQQKARGEEDENLASTQYMLFLPAGTDIDAGDVVVIEGLEYQMAGDPWFARDPESQTNSHVEATLVRTSGSEDGS